MGAAEWIALAGVILGILVWLIGVTYNAGKKSGRLKDLELNMGAAIARLDEMDDVMGDVVNNITNNAGRYREAMVRLKEVEVEAKLNSSDHARLFTQLEHMSEKSNELGEEVTKTFEAVVQTQIMVAKMTGQNGEDG